MKYRKKAIEIEAFQYDGDLIGTDGKFYIPAWAISAYHAGKILHSKEGTQEGLIISTLEGEMKASIGDYIIKGVQGELYPCKPDIFEATYEKVEETIELKSCPFCGSDKVFVVKVNDDEGGYIHVEDSFDLDEDYVFVHCYDCGVEVCLPDDFVTPGQVAEAWNKRTGGK